MSSRRLALIGASAGPWVYTAQIARPRVRVHGLRESSLTVTMRTDDVHSETVLLSDGVHHVETAHWMRITCSPPIRSVIAEIISGKV